MNQRTPREVEEALRYLYDKGAASKPQSDIQQYKVKLPNQKEPFVVAESRNEITGDNLTVTSTTFSLEDNGFVLEDSRALRLLSCGCKVHAQKAAKFIFLCAICSKSRCMAHCFQSHGKAFCGDPKSKCYAIGRAYQAGSLLLSIGKFCVGQVFGIEFKREKPATEAQTELRHETEEDGKLTKKMKPKKSRRNIVF